MKALAAAMLMALLLVTAAWAYGSSKAATSFTLKPGDSFRVAGTAIACDVIRAPDTGVRAFLCRKNLVALVATNRAILVLRGKPGQTLGQSTAVASVSW